IRGQESSALLQGLAPFVELHYNSTLGNADTVQAGRFLIAPDSAHVDELNLSAGFIAVLGERFQLSVGAVVPLRGGDNRTFDWQLGVRGNYFFGPTARNPNRGAFVPGF